MNKDVIIALDVDSVEKVETFLKEFKTPVYVKIGMELFYLLGPKVIDLIKSYNHKVFLDLKLHDIPNTVKNAMKVINKLNIDMVNVHALGGIKMMTEARNALDDNVALIAVTQLTSSDDLVLKEMQINTSVKNSVLNLASNAKKSGLNGVVCSSLEAAMIKEKLGKDFLCVTPGIRYQSGIDDQKRVVKPCDAKDSDYIVVGRPIMKNDNKFLEYKKIKKEFLNEH